MTKYVIEEIAPDYILKDDAGRVIMQHFDPDEFAARCLEIDSDPAMITALKLFFNRRDK